MFSCACSSLKLQMGIIYIILAVSMWAFTDAEEKLCLSCKNSPSSSNCNKVAKCGPYDMCYMELYMNTLGAIRYDFGCKDEHFCNVLSHSKRQAAHIHVCTHCCNSTMCNFAGCGNNDLPDRDQRGPLCFACDAHNNVDDCAEFKQCNRGEVCVLEQKTTPITGAETYSSGCMQAQTCENIYQKINSIFSMVGKRSFEHSISREKKCLIECCNGDFCNRGCGISSIQQNMGFQTGHQNIQHTTKTTHPFTQPTTPATSGTTRIPLFVSQKTTAHIQTKRPQTFSTFRVTQSQTLPVKTLTSMNHITSAGSGCVNDLPNWYCYSDDVLASLCHLQAHAHKCRKSCNLCQPTFG